MLIVSLVETDVSERRSKGTLPRPMGKGTLHLFERLLVCAGSFFELHANWHQPFAGVELRQSRTEVADGRHAKGFRETFGKKSRTQRRPGGIDADGPEAERNCRHDAPRTER